MVSIKFYTQKYNETPLINWFKYGGNNCKDNLVFFVTLLKLIEQLPWWTDIVDNPWYTPMGDGGDSDVFRNTDRNVVIY